MIKLVMNSEELEITQPGLVVLREKEKLTPAKQQRFKKRNNSQSWRRARSQ